LAAPQGWSKLYNDFPQHPKFIKAGPAAGYLYFVGQAYCSRYLTDGRIPKVVLVSLSGTRGRAKVVERLLSCGLWHDRGDYYEQHDYCEMQRTAAEVDTIRELGRDRQRRHRGVTRDKRVSNADGNADVTPTESESESESEEEPTVPNPEWPPWVQPILDDWISVKPLPSRARPDACLKVFHDLHRIDHNDPEEIARVCAWVVRTKVPEYIKSPVKLRKPTRDGDTQTFEMYAEMSLNGKPTENPMAGRDYLRETAQ